MPERTFRVTFKDGTSETVKADSLDQAMKKARRSGRRQISTREQGRKVVADVHALPANHPDNAAWLAAQRAKE
jgi:hypothetical protein